MTTARIVVTALGALAAGWVLWYFLAPLGASRAGRGGSRG